MRSRNEIPALLDSIGARQGVEVGVGSGAYSDYLLEHSKLSTLYSIDPWNASLPGYATQDKADTDLAHCRRLLSRHGERSKVIVGRAEFIVDEFADRSLSFVYVDSAHDFCDTFTQCVLWWHKIEYGGILAGHDYSNCLEVQLAVAAFCRHTGLSLMEVETTEDDNILPDLVVNSWIIRKKEGHPIDAPTVRSYSLKRTP
jgi:hypothetical protein